MELLEALEQLRVALDKSKVEPYSFFIQNSPDGYDCKPAVKAMEVFMQDELPEIRRLLEEVIQLCPEDQDE